MGWIVRKASGFTLIELMIVVAIIGILLAVAFPSYKEYVKRGKRADAKAYLLQVATKQQQYFMDARQYANQTTLTTTLGVAPSTSVSSNYTLTVTAAGGPPPSFTATLVPQGGMSGDYKYTINDQGVKQQIDSANNAVSW
jgi:type IV pilus assembly protein PilE